MKRTLIALVAGLVVFGGVIASASSLGGVSSRALGSGASVVASCDTDGVALAYTTAFDASLGHLPGERRDGERHLRRVLRSADRGRPAQRRRDVPRCPPPVRPSAAPPSRCRSPRPTTPQQWTAPRC